MDRYDDDDNLANCLHDYKIKVFYRGNKNWNDVERDTHTILSNYRNLGMR